MNHRADLFDIHLLEQEARRRCSTNGVNVCFKEDVPTACFDLKSHTVVLPALRPGTPWDETDYRGMLIHEIGHANRKEVIARANGMDMSSPFGRLLNAVEDEVLERGIAEEWYGDGVSLGLAQRRLMERDIKIVLDHEEAGTLTADADATKWTAAYAMCKASRTWDNISKSEREFLFDVLPEPIRKLHAELSSEGWPAKLRKAETCEEVFNFTKDLYKRLYPDDEKDPEDEARKNGGASGASGGESAKGKGGKDEEHDAIVDGKTHWSLLKEAEQTFKGGMGGKIDYTGYSWDKSGGASTLCPTKEQAPGERSRYSAGHTPSVPNLPVAAQLRILLLSEGKAKIKTELTSGRLDKRKLARLAMPVVPGTDSWRKVFRKRIPAKKLNTAISILVDGSGSMGGEKMAVAASSAAGVVKALTGPLRIPTAVTGFSHVGRDNICIPVKDFTEIKLPSEVASDLMKLPMSGNSDGESIMWAAERLLKRKEKRKILLVMSDGMPADHAPGVRSAGDTLNWAIKSCRDRGIEVYGIGIMDSSVKRFYGNDCKVIQNTSELAPALITTLGNKLHRS